MRVKFRNKFFFNGRRYRPGVWHTLPDDVKLPTKLAADGKTKVPNCEIDTSAPTKEEPKPQKSVALNLKPGKVDGTVPTLPV